MRLVMTAAAIAAIFTVSAYAEPVYEPGGPVQQGNLCKVTTSLSDSDEMSGYLQPCAPQVVRTKKKKS